MKPEDIYRRLDAMSTSELEQVTRIYRSLSARRDDPRSRHTKIFYRACAILFDRIADEHKTKSRAAPRLPDSPAAPDC